MSSARRLASQVSVPCSSGQSRWPAGPGPGADPCTAGQVLRQPDVPAAAAALGVRLPERLRSAADLPELHRPCPVAIATGLLRVSGGTVTCGPALEGWPPGDAELLTGWLAGLLAVCQASGTRAEEGDGLSVLVLAMLTVLQDDDVPSGRELWGRSPGRSRRSLRRPRPGLGRGPGRVHAAGRPVNAGIRWRAAYAARRLRRPRHGPRRARRTGRPRHHAAGPLGGAPAGGGPARRGRSGNQRRRADRGGGRIPRRGGAMGGRRRVARRTRPGRRGARTPRGGGVDVAAAANRGGQPSPTCSGQL